MRTLICLPILLLASACCNAAAPADLFDFWLGDWVVSWTNADGSPGRGRNRVAKVDDGAVIEEQFEDETGRPALRGRSLTVLHQASGQWKQAWADNQGGFFVFSGSVDGDKRIFASELVADGEQLKGQRMVFHSIERDALAWDWEGTVDGGRHWKRLWHIDYRRRR